MGARNGVGTRPTPRVLGMEEVCMLVCCWLLQNCLGVLLFRWDALCAMGVAVVAARVGCAKPQTQQQMRDLCCVFDRVIYMCGAICVQCVYRV